VSAPTDGDRRVRRALYLLAIALVVLRGFVATYYEGFFFDSDQAIVGLMARDLSRFHRFPLFYYSLNYLLAVQAWIVAPFFLVARSSVTVMRLPFVALNAAVAVALIWSLASELRIRPALAFVAALPFIIPSPGAANQLLELAGASVEPFAFVLGLWYLRRRPIAFGLLLAIAYLHREFTIFAVPALMIAERREWTSSPRERTRRLGRMFAGFAMIWIVVAVLKLRLAGASLGLQVASLRGQMCLEWPDLRGHAQALVTEALPALFGIVPMPLSAFRMTSMLVPGHVWVGYVVLGAVALMAVRLGSQTPKSDSEIRLGSQTGRSDFGVYLALVGIFTAAAYPLSCQVILHGPPILRYLLLALLVPIGLAAEFFRRERSRILQSIVAAVFVVWAGANLTDNVRLIREATADPPLGEHRALVNHLLAHQIRYARAIYWDAYMVDFLSRGRVIAASVDIVRIPEYQDEVDAHDKDAVFLQRLPCEGTERVASWCVRR
jgi:hypothetical protein